MSDIRWLPTLRDLDEKQREVIYSSLNKGHHLLYGPAGCGKTSITLYCAKTLQDTQKSYLIITFTHVLKHFIRVAADDLGIPLSLVWTFYSWVRWQHYHLIGMPPSGEIDPYSQWVDNLIRYFTENPDDIPRYDYVLVDEAQDFKPNVARLLHMLTDNVFVAGDTSQSLYGDFHNIQELVDRWRPLHKEFELVNNYRNTKTVARVASLFLDGSSLTAEEFLQRVKGRDYEMKPVWYQVSSYEEQTQKVIELIQQARGSERIGILYRKRELLYAEASRMQKQKVSFQIAISNQGFYNLHSPLPTLTTVHSAKGLEFDWVILPYLNQEIWDGHVQESQERRLFFVALTRTKSNLYLISLAGQECAYLKEIQERAPDILQTPVNTNFSRTYSEDTAFDSDDPF